MIRISSNAKVNIGLRILGRRPEDGYHLIETIFQEIDLSDTITIEENSSGNFTMECNLSVIPVDQSNVIIQAAEKMKKYFPKTFGAHFKLEKNIPIGAGLGGGSANAAAVINYLGNKYGITVTKRLIIGVLIGADVPFFIQGGTQYASGIGEILRPMKLLEKFTILLVFPTFGISTPWAYRQLKISLTDSHKDSNFADVFNQSLDWSLFENEFEDVIIPAHPQIGEIKRSLQAQGAVFSSLSGSGSTVFGIFKDRKSAEKAKEKLATVWNCKLSEPIFR